MNDGMSNDERIPNDETPRGVILGFRIFVIPSSFVIRISTFARMGGENSRLQLAGQLGD